MIKPFQKISFNVIPDLIRNPECSRSNRESYRFRIKCGMTENDLKSRGFSLVEIIVAIGLAAIFIPAIGIAYSFAIQSTSQGEKYSQAYQLAQEGMEAIFNLKSQSGFWPAFPNPDGQYYQPSQSGGAWQLGALIPENNLTPISNTNFIRKIGIKEVCRNFTDPNKIFVSCDNPQGSLDEQTNLITVYVDWPEKGENREVKLEAYVTQH